VDSRDSPHNLVSRKINCTFRGLNCGVHSLVNILTVVGFRESETAGEGGKW